MSNILKRDDAINTARLFAEHGFSVHWLKPKDKMPDVRSFKKLGLPIDTDWAKLPTQSAEDLAKSYITDQNIGIRPGEWSIVCGKYFLHVIDFDFRQGDNKEAIARLKEILPNSNKLPTVLSGSGNGSRHYYFFTDKPFSSHGIAKSGVKFFDEKVGRNRWTWEIELFGTGKQLALPPSIHPSGAPYTWLRELDFDDLEMGIIPFIPSDIIESWGVAETKSKPKKVVDDLEFGAEGYIGDDDDEDTEPLGLDEDKAWDILSRLDITEWCDDRDGWLKVGMAIHHEFDGQPEGIDLWSKFSQQSDKFDPKDLRRVWRSFGDTDTPVRMATLLAAVTRREEVVTEDDFEPAAVTREKTPIKELPEIDPNWIELMDVTEKGYASTLPNVELILQNDIRIRGLMEFNEFSKEVVQRRLPGKLKKSKRRTKAVKQLKHETWDSVDTPAGSRWQDIHDKTLRLVIESPRSQGGYGIKVTDRDMVAAVEIVARQNKFHPVRDYLRSLTADGGKRVERLFIEYLGCEDNAYHRETARLFMVAAVARVHQPGCKFDFAPIIEGDQGIRKSTFVKTLGCNFFGEVVGDVNDDKKMVECMQGKWIMEIPELSGFGYSDIRDIKAFMSRQVENVRMSYARRATEYPRQNVLAGTSNDSKYLKDPTGGRRFWPIVAKVKSIDIDKLQRNVDLLWAEAVVMYDSLVKRNHNRGELPLYIEDEEASAYAMKMQESRRQETVEDMKMGDVVAFLNSPDDETGFDENAPVRTETCVRQVWVEAMGGTLDNLDWKNIAIVTSIMERRKDWDSTGESKMFAGYGVQAVWKRIG